MKCVVYFQGVKEAQSLTKRLASDFKNLQFAYPKDKRQLLKEIEDAEVLFGGFVDEETIDKAKKLRWFHCAAAGVDYIIKTMREHPHILFTSSKGVSEEQISEWVIAMTLYTLKHVKQLQRLYDSKKLVNLVEPLMQDELFGKTVCIVGLGRIGKRAAQKFNALGCRVLGIKREKAEFPYIEKVGTLEDLKDFFSESDIISTHLALTEKTKGCINREAINSMKENALFINTARGALVDEKALIERLNRREIRALLDVIQDEPIKEGNPLLSTTNLLVTPHVSYNSKEFYGKLFDLFSANLKLYLQGRKDSLINVVNLRLGY